MDQRSNLTYRPFVDRILASDAAADFEARSRARAADVATRALDLVLDPAEQIAS